MAIKVTKKPKNERVEIKVKTKVDNQKPLTQGYKWWEANSKAELAQQLIDTAGFLKQQQQYRYRQAAMYGRLYGNMPLTNYIGSSYNRISPQNNLPVDRPTMNVIQSCVDTLVSRISQSRPRPVFLTDNSDYRERNLAKQLNNFIQGELYQTKAYELGPLVLRDSSVFSTGCLKVFETNDHKVGLERVILTDLYVDMNDARLGNPRTLYQMALVDRDVLKDYYPDAQTNINKAEQAYPDASSEATQTVSDQVMIVESWHLPSGKESNDGRHTIACSAGIIFDEDYKKDRFPFAFLHYSPPLLGFWGQGLAEQLMGTQVEINKLLITITNSINLVGVPRVFIEKGSKVLKAHLNNMIGAIVPYEGEKPSYEVAPCVPVELYQQLQRLVDYAYQQSGISALSAAAQKPQGLNSGTAIREYDDLQSDRFASLNRRYDNFYIDLAYLIIDKAKDIAERDGKYQTVYPNKNGTKEIDLPAAKLLDDPFVIQCFDASSLPRDPAGRKQWVVEMMQAGLISPQEGRRLLDYPDLEQVEKLANSGEERILQILDDIVDTGKYVPPDPFMDISLATELVTQYYNLYAAAKLEESKAQKLRDFFSQLQALKQTAMAGMQAQPQAVPQAPPQSDLLPNVQQGA